MDPAPDSLRPEDLRILRYLAENPPDYVPLVANRLGLHLGYAERRVDALVDAGLVEAITGEEVYAVTTDGEQYVAEHAPVSSANGDR